MAYYTIFFKCSYSLVNEQFSVEICVKQTFHLNIHEHTGDCQRIIFITDTVFFQGNWFLKLHMSL